jgi:rod shape-determining protein MreB and related proteins
MDHGEGTDRARGDAFPATGTGVAVYLKPFAIQVDGFRWAKRQAQAAGVADREVHHCDFRRPGGDHGGKATDRWTTRQASALLELRRFVSFGLFSRPPTVSLSPATITVLQWLNFKRGFLPANEIAVDLGTANTLIYVRGEGIVLNEPSVVAIEKANGKIKGIGLEAKRMLGRTPDGIVAVRPLKDGVIADFDVTEKMLRYFLKTIIDKHVFKVKPKVIVCVPSGITEVEKRAVRDSAQSAGANQVFMVAEPMAAAIGVGLPVETPTGNMVIDIGGGTTEIAVIALSGIVSDTSIRTGGDEMDQAIVQFMRKNYNLLIGEPTAEQVKIAIGSAAPVGEEKEAEVKGRDLVSGIPKTVRVHASEIREAIQEPIQQIVDAVRRALEITPPELASDIVDRGIVMTGGGALIRGLDVLLSQETGLPIHVDEDPLTCVVRGVGRILDDPEKYRNVMMT